MLIPDIGRVYQRAGLACVGWLNVLHRDAAGFRLVLDEGLQLPPCPAAQPCAHALACLDARPDVRQILQHDLARTRCNGSGHDGFARLLMLGLMK